MKQKIFQFDSGVEEIKEETVRSGSHDRECAAEYQQIQAALRVDKPASEESKRREKNNSPEFCQFERRKDSNSHQNQSENVKVDEAVIIHASN